MSSLDGAIQCGAVISTNEITDNEKAIYDRKGVNEMSLVKASDINKEKLIEILTNAALDVTDQDEPNEVYVKGLDFPLWIFLDEENQSIMLRSFMQCIENAPLEELPILSEKCNSEYRLVTFTSTAYDDGRGFINGTYYMYYNFGLIAHQLVYTIKKFSSIFIGAIRNEDPEDKFFA